MIQDVDNGRRRRNIATTIATIFAMAITIATIIATTQVLLDCDTLFTHTQKRKVGRKGVR
jgi:hypothetical protein